MSPSLIPKLLEWVQVELTLVDIVGFWWSHSRGFHNAVTSTLPTWECLASFSKGCGIHLRGQGFSKKPAFILWATLPTKSCWSHDTTSTVFFFSKLHPPRLNLSLIQPKLSTRTVSANTDFLRHTWCQPAETLFWKAVSLFGLEPCYIFIDK